MAMDSATLYKLMILYMLNKVDFPLTNSQISKFFENKIPNAIIDDMDTFLITNKYELRNEVGTVSDYYRVNDGDYIVHCQVNEDASTLIEINLTVPNKESAAKMCAKWKDASQEIYEMVITKLTK